MSKQEFEELARNDYRGALMALWAEVTATQETVIELSAAVNAPAETVAAE